MNLENHFENRPQVTCGPDRKALSPATLAGWRRGYAADCKSVNAFCISDNEINAINPASHSDNTPGHSANGPGTLTTGYTGHPYDNLPCRLTDNPRQTAAAIVALCLIVGVAGAFGLALWGLV